MKKREESKKIGKDLLLNELSKHGIDFEKNIKPDKEALLVKAGKEGNFEELLVAIGYGKLNAKDIVQKVFPENETEEKSIEKLESSSEDRTISKPKGTGILVSGLRNVLVTFGKCCNPLPGEEIEGFITRGRGFLYIGKVVIKQWTLTQHEKLMFRGLITKKSKEFILFIYE